MLGTQTVLLIENSMHQVGGAQNALHQEVGLTLGAQRHGLGRAVLIGVAGDDLVVGGVLAQCGKHGADLVTAFQMGVAGVAWATFLCQGISCVLAVSVVFRRLKQIPSEGKTALFSGQLLGRFVVIATIHHTAQLIVSRPDLFENLDNHNSILKIGLGADQSAPLVLGS